MTAGMFRVTKMTAGMVRDTPRECVQPISRVLVAHVTNLRPPRECQP
jgi:hypothetical protein